MENQFETEYFRFEINDGILTVSYKKGVTITLAVAKEVVSKRLKFIEGSSLPTLVRDEGVVSFDKDARDFLSSKEGTVGVTAGALVLKSPFSKFLGNFFLSINRPVIPAKLFTDENKAIQWLQRYREEEEVQY